METTELGTTGLHISRIGFGGIPIQRLDEEEAIEVVDCALQHGCRLIDTARERYAEMSVHADACEACGRCEERCPYDLPIRDMLEEAHAVLTR